MKKQMRLFLGAILFLGLFFFCFQRSFLKLTYIECTVGNEKADGFISIEKTGDEFIQEFQMPYDILSGISIQINTFARDNNSEWSFYITGSDQSILCKKDFNASLLADNGYYYIELDKKLRLKKGESYKFHIYAKNVRSITALGFYKSDFSMIEDADLYWNGEKIDGDLCFKVYGGDVDYWWAGLTVVLFVYFFFILCRLYRDKIRKISFKNDVVLQSFLLVGIVFLLMSSFAVSGTFTDESDNIRGGMIIARGGVLYRDYVTQHTPVVYYLCSIFALLGAGSVQQFRLSYYIVTAVIWGFLYGRHESVFGKRKMFLLPILEVIFITSVVPGQGWQILSDGVQGLCMVALLLEFLRYKEDKAIGWDRCIVISACIWGSFGSAFVSAYAILVVVMIVVVLEGFYWSKEKISLKGFFQRYYKLMIAVIVPLICAILYFKWNQCLGRAYQQFYLFNREVYPKYTDFGDNLLQPFVNAVNYFFSILANNMNQIVQASATSLVILQLVIVVCATMVVIMLAVKKRYVEAITLFLVMCCCATRGYGFHGMAAWYVAVMIILLFIEELRSIFPKIGAACLGIAALYMLSIYINSVSGNLLYKQTAVSELESRIVEITEDKEDILLDAYCCDSIYLLYKNRYPVNKAVYMLPWYMDWYEEETVQTLQTNRPRIVVYYPEQQTWVYSYYTNYFATALREDYTQISDNPEDGWKYRIWIRNDSSK